MQESEAVKVSENDRLLAPPRPLLSRNPMQWLRFFGPGAIIASLNVGSGEVLFPSRSGAIFGYDLLWIFLLFSVLKWAMAYSSMRHMMLTGAHPYERWSSLPGPRGWLPLFIIIVALLCSPVWNSFMQGILGSVSTWIFGVGDLHIWATVWVAVSLVLLAMGGYNFLEKTQLVILGSMLVAVFVALVYVGPDWWGVLKGLFLPQVLVYPDWVPQLYPSFRDRSEWVEYTVYAAAIGGQSYDYFCYASFLRDKRWGRADMGIASAEEVARIAESKKHPVRVWVRAGVIDTVLSFAMIVLIAAAFAILGAMILQPQKLVPDGVDLLNHQAQFLTTLSPALLPLYQLAVFLAFFGSLYAGPEMGYRICNEFLLTLPRWRDRLPAGKIRWAVIFWTLGGGLSILWLSRPFPGVTLIDIITPAGLYTGVLLCGFYCLANVWVDWRFLPAPLRMPGWLVALNVIGGVIFGYMGLTALWDHTVWHAVIFPAVLFAAMFLAFQLRFLYQPPRTGTETRNLR